MSTKLPQQEPPTVPASGPSESEPTESGPAEPGAEWLERKAQVPPSAAGERVDRVAAQIFSDFSRAVLGGWLRTGELKVNGERALPKTKLKGGEWLQLSAQSPAAENWHSAQPVDFAVVYEDADLLVINKPVGLVVHPGAGNFDGTLVNGLLHYRPQLAELPRAGIVHRLDKDTSGLMVVAASFRAHTQLVQALQARDIGRRYCAVVEGVLERGQKIDKPIGRDRAQPTRQRITASGKRALTLVSSAQRFRAHCEITAELKTGRTHQIRVHLASLGLPLVGDTRYGAKGLVPPNMNPEHEQIVRNFKRQALHAQQLLLNHPVTAAPLEFSEPPPADYQQLVAALQTDAANQPQDLPHK